MPKKPLTLQQAADKLGVHYMTVYRYVRTGKLPATRVGGAWQVDPDDLAQMKRAAPRAPATRPPGPPPPKPSSRPGCWPATSPAPGVCSRPPWPLIARPPRCSSSWWHLPSNPSGTAGHSASSRWPTSIGRVRWRCGSSPGIGARFARRGPKRGSVVLTTPPAEQHSAPVAIAADLLRWAGFNVIELGADTPADALAQALAGVPDLLAVAMACTTTDSTTSARRVIAHLRTALPGTTVLLGGAAIADADQALRLGADGFTGRRGDDLVRAVEELAAAR